ncbi:hypothetical protein [Ensifer sp. B1-9]|uniref:hypothetical protein n=1 Tax=Ensifer sp. B1-9 TaxID=3141455 RepID=UPI003D1A4E4A
MDDHDPGEGAVSRRQVRIDKSWERLFDGEVGLSIEEGKKIMAALQSAVVSHEAETYSLFRRVCPDRHSFRPVKDYTTRQIRTVFGTVEARNLRWVLCGDCHPGIAGAFAPLKEICPDRATRELMEPTARLGSMMPAEFLPVEPTETHAAVRQRTIKIGERLDDRIAQDERRASPYETDERRQPEMHLPGDRRKEFVISIDTAQVRSADPNSARSFELVVARCERRMSRSFEDTVPAARTEHAFDIQTQATTPACRLTPEKLPVSAERRTGSDGFAIRNE